MTEYIQLNIHDDTYIVPVSLHWKWFLQGDEAVGEANDWKRLTMML